MNPLGPTAVVCEDDPVSRRVASATLERCGYRVVAGVDTVMDATRAAQVFQPDVMVLDLMLPWVSGEFGISFVREVAPRCTIIVCSAFDARDALASGASFAVPKGSAEELEAVLWTLDHAKQGAGA
ncbi:MAG TPA: response regulator [Acidimicrobiales bacterium]|nr:response regulator [Acidimicrobiales bacterium]